MKSKLNTFLPVIIIFIGVLHSKYLFAAENEATDDSMSEYALSIKNFEIGPTFSVKNWSAVFGMGEVESISARQATRYVAPLYWFRHPVDLLVTKIFNGDPEFLPVWTESKLKRQAQEEEGELSEYIDDKMVKILSYCNENKDGKNLLLCLSRSTFVLIRQMSLKNPWIACASATYRFNSLINNSGFQILNSVPVSFYYSTFISHEKKFSYYGHWLNKIEVSDSKGLTYTFIIDILNGPSILFPYPGDTEIYYNQLRDRQGTNLPIPDFLLH